MSYLFRLLFSDAFAKLRRVTISFVTSVCLSFRSPVHLYAWNVQAPTDRTDCREILYSNIFRKSVKNIKISVKSDINNGYFPWNPVYAR